jgi:hypothetical protein
MESSIRATYRAVHTLDSNCGIESLENGNSGLPISQKLPLRFLPNLSGCKKYRLLCRAVSGRFFSAVILCDPNRKTNDSEMKVFGLKSLGLGLHSGGQATPAAGDLAHIALADIGVLGFFSA